MDGKLKAPTPLPTKPFMADVIFLSADIDAAVAAGRRSQATTMSGTGWRRMKERKTHYTEVVDVLVGSWHGVWCWTLGVLCWDGSKRLRKVERPL